MTDDYKITSMTKYLSQDTVSVAPMLDWTDRHCRYFLRQVAPSVKLYTEMISTGAIIHGDTNRFLQFNEGEQPVALQLGGSDRAELATCAKKAADYGYDEVNLNCGCPSDRVQRGRFGACLMKEPDLVADCVKAMQDASSLPVTVKTRIGIDEHEDYSFLQAFLEPLIEIGCTHFIIHARKAWLKGLSPKENREIPPLSYDTAYRVKQDYPDCKIIVNGGITNTKDSLTHIEQCDGVMIGREAYSNPCFLAELETTIFNTDYMLDRRTIIETMQAYVDEQAPKDVPTHSITRHMMGLFKGQPGGRKWRQYLSENARDDQNVLMNALCFIEKA